MTAKIDVAIVGATGSIGEAIVGLLAKREFPVNNLYLLASERTAGTSLMFNGKPVMVTELNKFDFSKAQLAIFVATDAVSAEMLPQAQAHGCLTIDNSQIFAESAPLVVPYVNGQLLLARPEIVVNPDSNVIPLATILKLLDDRMGVERVNVTAIQSVSGHGKKAISAEPKIYPQQIAFNVLPYVGEIRVDGHTDVEKRLVTQTRRVLGNNSLNINVSSVQVPVFYADSMMVSIDTRTAVSLKEIKETLESCSEIIVLDDDGGKHSATPVTHSTGKESIFVSRIRHDMSSDQGINLWVTTDNIRKSAAINTILIAESLIKV
jgi:aspartate-semialdehyde dehydrogenase